MKKVVFVVGLALGWAHIGHLSAATTLIGNAAAGKDQTVVCSACHGADGNSAVPTFPKLAGQGERYTLKQLKNIRDGARPIASMVGQLDDKTDQQLADIAAFYASQTGSGGQTDPDLLALGQKVYRAGIAERDVAACAGCHSPTGKGNGPAGFPSLAGQHADYIADQLRMYRKGYEDETGRTNDGESKIMRTTAFSLSDKEIDAVASYISGLK